ncbi:uncharacterized protein LOC131317987 isoform X2 [Rhododendron vialii]|uniref:uncharacterized protein LOC131317987 isoform X2 n=1 Tax=Rhododendron vialii TaxID=182163 RepID=UPI00265E168D|nr:uncharacterized protein LOC131317987 isoform X2 [Rhododendron vialii]
MATRRPSSSASLWPCLQNFPSAQIASRQSISLKWQGDKLCFLETLSSSTCFTYSGSTSCRCHRSYLCNCFLRTSTTCYIFSGMIFAGTTSNTTSTYGHVSHILEGFK